MTRHLVLSSAELSLILELLERDQRLQLIAIRHIATPDFRTALRERLTILESLIQRAQAATVSS